MHNLTLHNLQQSVERNKTIDPGIAFVRKHRPEKSKARNDLMKLFSRRSFPKSLSILTFPSVNWSFEKSLLDARERPRVIDHRRPSGTYITSIERNKAIYLASLKEIPRANFLKPLNPPNFAYLAIKSQLIIYYLCCSFHDFANNYSSTINAAWLDFNGPLTHSSLEDIEKLWKNNLTHRLVITFMKGRHDLADEIQTEGSVQNILIQKLKAPLIYSLEYRDTTSMLQLGFDKPKEASKGSSICIPLQ